jgi:hypothetical protein
MDTSRNFVGILCRSYAADGAPQTIAEEKDIWPISGAVTAI